MNDKNKIKLSKKVGRLPNELQRAERWSGSRVTRNRKKYTRKGKDKFKVGGDE